jgi:hypothetical protein
MGNTFRLWRGLHATVNDVEGAAASTMKAVSFPTMVETTAVPLEIVLVVVTRCFAGHAMRADSVQLECRPRGRLD